MIHRRRAIVATLFGTSGAALAQPVPVEPPATEAVAAEAPAAGLEDIIVTARRRAETLQSVPVIATAISGETARRADLTSLEKVAATMPGFQVARAATGSGAALTLRGIGSAPGSIGIEQSVAVVVDSVYYGQGRIINEGFFDLDRIEILKGPQALFFGKNATAGVISITSANPTDSLSGSVRAGYEFNARQVYGEGILSGPLTDRLGFRVAVRAAKAFGALIPNEAAPATVTARDAATNAVTTFVASPADRDQPGGRELIARGTLRWEADDRLTATLKGSYNIDNTNNGGWNNLIVACPKATQALSGRPCTRRFTAYQNNIPTEIARTFPIADADGSLLNRYRSWQVTGTIDYTLDAATVTWVTNFNRNVNRFVLDSDVSDASISNTFAAERTTFRAFSSELRVQTTYDGPVNLLGGVYYQKTRRRLDQAVFAGNSENSAVADPINRYIAFAKDSGTDGETISGYGQASWKPIETIELAAGVRYTRETKDSFFRQPYSNPRFAFYIVSAERFDANTVVANQLFTNWSPEATVTWRPSSDVTVFAAYKTAYKSGGFSNTGSYTVAGRPTDLSFGPEKASGFEGGIKTTLFDRQIRFNLGIYHYKYDDLQADFFNSATFGFITTNAGSVKSDGAEATLEYAPRGIEGLNLRAALNYNKSRYGTFIAPCYTGQSFEDGCNTRAFGTTGQDLSGRVTGVSPRWTGALGGGYERPVGGLVAGLDVNARYSDDYLASAFGAPLSRQKSYVSLDASARVRTEDERIEFALIGKNLTNRFIITGSTDAPSTGARTGASLANPAATAPVLADVRGYVAPPRTIQAQMTYRF